jgi:phospholipid/cholesterol/gamma-HCH transport system substrate-binding protein
MKKDWRERELTMEVIVGAFMVAVFLGLGYFTIILSKEALFRSTTEMKVVFSDVMGLRVGDNVVVRGMPVGKIKTLELLEEEDCTGVCATLMLDKPITLHEGYQIKIATTSILGGRQMQIIEGEHTSPALNQKYYHGSDPYDLMADAAQIVNAARKQLIEGEVFEKVRHVATQVDQIVSRVNAGEGLLGKILSSDDTLYNDLQASAASLRGITQRLQNGEGAAGKLLSGDSTLVDDLEATVATTRRIAERVEKGEGTLGKFLADDSVYNEIEATIGEVRAAVDDFRETAPVTTFSSIFYGAF